jgi:hypothetical protein
MKKGPVSRAFLWWSDAVSIRGPHAFQAWLSRSTAVPTGAQAALKPLVRTGFVVTPGLDSARNCPSFPAGWGTIGAPAVRPGEVARELSRSAGCEHDPGNHEDSGGLGLLPLSGGAAGRDGSAA